VREGINMTQSPPIIVVREPGRSALFLLVVESIYVGRSGSGILLEDPQVSRQHIELIPSENGLRVRDCNSTHGSYIDGIPIKDEAILESGSKIRLGNVTIELAEIDIGGQFDNKSLTSDSLVTSIDRVADLVSPEDAVKVSKQQSERTLSIVFSDIEGSTELAVAAGDTNWFVILSEHNRLLRESAHKHGGTIVKSYGDGFMMTFLSARGAVDALIDVQEELAQVTTSDVLEGIKVRVGIHVGEAIADEGGDLFGRHVNIAARIAAHAVGGEILVSPLVREIIEARGDLKFGEPRVVSLKGISNSYVVHSVEWS